MTPRAVAVERALEAVTVVNDTIDKMASTGELRKFNRAFKEARAVDPSIRYFDYIHARNGAARSFGAELNNAKASRILDVQPRRLSPVLGGNVGGTIYFASDMAVDT